MRAKILCFCILCVISVFYLTIIAAYAEPVTVFVPSTSSVDEVPGIKSAEKGKKNPKNEVAADAAYIPEVDILITMMKPYEHAGLDMDMPQMFAWLAYFKDSNAESPGPERKDLLSDVEEIRYLDKKAWGANVALEKPGLYQFIMDAKPWWDAENDIYLQQHAKVILPVLGVSEGWNSPAGQTFEILPLTRPFGLVAPALFSGRVLLDGKPFANAPIYMGRINTAKAEDKAQWHKRLEAVSDSSGQFAFVLNQPGWWYCEAEIPGSPLKGPDGQLKQVARSAILWLYIGSIH